MSIFKILLNRRSSKKERIFLEATKVKLSAEKDAAEKVKIAIDSLEYIRDNLRTKNWESTKSTGLSALYNKVISASSLKEQVTALSDKTLVGWGTAWDSDLRGYFQNLHVDDSISPVNLKNESEKQTNLEQIKKENSEYQTKLKELQQKLEELNKQTPKSEEKQRDTEIKNKINEFKREKEAYGQKLKNLNDQIEQLKAAMNQKEKKFDQDKLKLDNEKQDLISKLNQMRAKEQNDIKINNEIQQFKKEKKSYDENLKILENNKKIMEEERQSLDSLKKELESRQEILNNQETELNKNISNYKREKQNLETEKKTFENQGNTPFPWNEFMSLVFHHNKPNDYFSLAEQIADFFHTNLKSDYKIKESIPNLYEKLETAESLYKKFEILSNFDFKSVYSENDSGDQLNKFFKNRLNELKELKSQAEIIIQRGYAINIEDVKVLSEYLDCLDPSKQESTYSKCYAIICAAMDSPDLSPNFNKLRSLEGPSDSVFWAIVTDLQKFRIRMSPEKLAEVLLKIPNINEFKYSNRCQLKRENDYQKLLINCEVLEMDGRYICRNSKSTLCLLFERKDAKEKYEPLENDKIVYSGPALTIYEIPIPQKIVKKSIIKSKYSTPETSARTLLEIIEANFIRNQDDFEVLKKYLKTNYKNWNKTCDECLFLIKKYVKENYLITAGSYFDNILKTMSKLNMIWDDLVYILYSIEYNNNNLKVTEDRIVCDTNETFEINAIISSDLRNGQTLLFEYKGYKIIKTPIWTPLSVDANKNKTDFNNILDQLTLVYKDLFKVMPDKLNSGTGLGMISNLYKNNNEYRNDPIIKKALKNFDHKTVIETFFTEKLKDKDTGQLTKNPYYLFNIYPKKSIKILKKYLLIAHYLFINDNKTAITKFWELTGTNNIQNNGNCFNGTKTIDTLLGRAKSILEDLQEFYSFKGGYRGDVVLSRIGKIREDVLSKSKLKLSSDLSGMFLVDTYHYPIGTKFQKFEDGVKADLYALGVCFIEMLFKCNFADLSKNPQIVNSNYNLASILIDSFKQGQLRTLTSLIDPNQNTNLCDIYGKNWSLYTIYKTSEATKIKNFAYMIRDMLNYRFNISHCLHQLKDIEKQNTQNNAHSFSAQGQNQRLCQPFKTGIDKLKSSFKSSITSSTNKEDLIIKTLRKFRRLIFQFICGDQTLITNTFVPDIIEKNCNNDEKVLLFIGDRVDETLYKNIRSWLLSNEIKYNKESYNYACNVFPAIKKFLESMLGYIKVLLVSKDQKSESITLKDQDMRIRDENDENDQPKYWISAIGKKFCLIKDGKPSLSEDEIQQGNIGNCWLEATIRSMLDNGTFNFEKTFINYKNELEEFTDPSTHQKYYIVSKNTAFVTVRLYKVVVNCHLKLRGSVFYNAIYARPTGKYIDIKMNQTYLAYYDASSVGNRNFDNVLWMNFIEKAITVGRVQKDLVTFDKGSLSDGFIGRVEKLWKQDPEKLAWETLMSGHDDGISYSILTGKNAKGEMKLNNVVSNSHEQVNLLYNYIKQKLTKGERLSAGLNFKQSYDIPYAQTGHSANETMFYLNGDKSKVFVINHEYSISKLETINGQKIITLKNPWGQKQREKDENISGFDTLEMTLEEFYLRYGGISKGKV